MALKNDETVSVLGKRLLDLMEEGHIESPKALATTFYDQNLVPVSTRVHDNDEYDIRLSAIGSIEKKIVRHIKTGLISDKTGQYILAYCKVFNCSSDFILGLTDIRTADLETRRICELTGLSETVILRFIENNNIYGEYIAHYWSNILEQPLFDLLPHNLQQIFENAYEQYCLKSIMRVTDWQIGQYPKDDHDMFQRLDNHMMNCQDRIEELIPSYQGMLYKTSRDLTETIEQIIKDKYESMIEQKTKEHLQSAKKYLKQGKLYLLHPDLDK